MENNYGYIYKTVLKNGKIYIGQHKSNKNKDYSYYGSGALLNKDDIKSTDILEYCTIENINSREKYWIKKYNSIDKSIGVNLTIGGSGSKRKSSELEAEIHKLKDRLKEAKEELQEQVKEQNAYRKKTIQELRIDFRIATFRRIYNEFFKEEDINEYWADVYSDCVYLLTEECEDTNYKQEVFGDVVNEELEESIGQLASEQVNEMRKEYIINKNYFGKILEKNPNGCDDDNYIINKVREELLLDIDNFNDYIYWINDENDRYTTRELLLHD